MFYKLLPSRYKTIGLILLVPAVIAGIAASAGYEANWLNAKVFTLFDTEIFGKSQWLKFVEANLTSTLAGALFIASAILVAFSKEKQEDEFIAKLRLSSLLWAVCVNYILLLLSFLFVYGVAFLTVMVYNMFTVLILFIIRFNYLLYKNNKMVPDEKYS